MRKKAQRCMFFDVEWIFPVTRGMNFKYEYRFHLFFYEKNVFNSEYSQRFEENFGLEDFLGPLTARSKDFL